MRKRPSWIIPLLPSLLVLVGAALNCLAITVNHGLMPYVQDFGFGFVMPGTITDPRHVAWYPGVHLGFLCDWIQWFGESVCSPGDLCLWLGDWLTAPVLVVWAALNIFGSAE